MNMEERIESVLRKFDFDKLQIAMEAVKWEWRINNAFRVPTASELKEEARRLLNDSLASGMRHSCGGFSAGYDKEENELYLDFCFDYATA